MNKALIADREFILNSKGNSTSILFPDIQNFSGTVSGRLSHTGQQNDRFDFHSISITILQVMEEIITSNTLE